MKEIGGYFQLEELAGKEYYPDLIKLNLGRTALLFLLQALNTNKLAVPYFLCDSVTQTCLSAGIQLRYYAVKNDFMPEDSFVLEENEYLYLVNYYGQLSDAAILQLKSKYPLMIADYTHCFFQKPLSDIPTIYSCRKYFGLPDGAYVYLPETSYTLPKEEDFSSDRMSHILGRYEHSASEHYKEMLTTAHSFEYAPVLRMSRLTQNLLKAIPYDEIKKQRTENFKVLEEALSILNPLTLSIPDGAFCYPFMHPEAPILKKALAKRSIFVPTYWANVIEHMPEDSLEYAFARNILPIPCDQRYDEQDMRYVVQILLEEMKNLEKNHD